MSTELTLEKLQLEQKALVLKTFNYDFVWALGSRLREAAVAREAPVAIEVRHGFDIVFANLLPGATIDNFDWTRRKCASVQRFHKSSLALRLEAESGNFDFNRKFRLSPADFVAGGGGYPLILDEGTLIGSVGVSGLPDVDDHMLITTVLHELLS
ncbi:heme-degrading domain-containing protein [Roseinatronobacter sp. S2]|uniref:heme-degrading domain-containing protein n=1 Tax=Roseinatronobacter sp. S2 TaxID=3035471 RepID=UPI00240F2B15|nr:heme-binding protein [Roseinatronobacter sp. S2]WFE73366.1 heme-binding protein [Roseinatronobacter sp. S2]